MHIQTQARETYIIQPEDAPERIDNRTLSPANMVVVPMPRLRVDRLAHAAEHAQTAQIVILHVVLAQATKKTDGGGRGVELRDLVLVYGLPVSRRSRVHGRGFEDGRGYAIDERAIHDVTRFMELLCASSRFPEGEIRRT